MEDKIIKIKSNIRIYLNEFIKTGIAVTSKKFIINRGLKFTKYSRL